MALALLLAGCGTLGQRNESMSSVTIFMSVPPGAIQTGTTETVSILRSDPVQVTVDRQPVLSEQNLVAAKVIDTPAAPAIELKFDPMGTVILEQCSATNPGGHFAIYGQWGKDLKEKRWLMAPLITGRIKDGILSFTPDMSRAEATNFVEGLNNVAKTFQTTPTE